MADRADRPTLTPPSEQLPSVIIADDDSQVSIPPAPVSRSLPPLPAVEPLLEEAARLRTKKEWDAAHETYKKALFLVDKTDTTTLASLYAYVAEVKLAQGKSREAETNFEKALAQKPVHLRSIEGLITLAEGTEEWERVVTYRSKRIETLEDQEEKANELCRLAEVYESHFHDLHKAAQTYEQALGLRAGDVGILLKLRQVYETVRNWTRVLEVLDELARTAGKAKDRGVHRFAQADVVLGRLRDEPRGVAYLEMALDEDPQNDRALSALIAVRTRREEWAELGAVYERLIDRFAGIGDGERAWEVVRKLGTLRRDKLTDGPGAIEAFQGAVDLRPDDTESRAALAELFAARGDRNFAVRELEVAATHAPFRAQTYRRLHELHGRAQRPDRAWLAATCLEELGAADVAHELVIEQYRPDGPIRPTTALAEAWWDEHLRAPGADPIVCDVLRAVAPAAIAARLEELAAKKKLPAIDASTKADKASTASVVRTFVWASRALDIPAPDLYLLDEVPSGVAAVPAASPGAALGPQVRSGMTVQQLAFVAARHLTYYRPEHYALVFFPTLADLSALVLSAVRLVIPEIGEGGEKSPLKERLTDEQKSALEDAVKRLDARGGKLDLLAWIRHVELTAARAGLLLAGDLRVAMRILKSEGRSIGELSLETKRGDLLAFTASESYGILRERMGVAILPPAVPEE